MSTTRIFFLEMNLAHQLMQDLLGLHEKDGFTRLLLPGEYGFMDDASFALDDANAITIWEAHQKDHPCTLPPHLTPRMVLEAVSAFLGGVTADTLCAKGWDLDDYSTYKTDVIKDTLRENSIFYQFASNMLGSAKLRSFPIDGPEYAGFSGQRWLQTVNGINSIKSKLPQGTLAHCCSRLYLHSIP